MLHPKRWSEDYCRLPTRPSEHGASMPGTPWYRWRLDKRACAMYGRINHREQADRWGGCRTTPALRWTSETC
eukprot:2345407-Prorocentrum_lima.AAC.1